MNYTPPFLLKPSIDSGIALRLIGAALRRRRRDSIELKAEIAPAALLKGSANEYVFTRIASPLLTEVLAQLKGDPLRVLSAGNRRLKIRLFDALDYVVDRKEQSAWAEPSPATKREIRGGQYIAWGHPIAKRLEQIDLLNPLSKPGWLIYIACRLGLTSPRNESGNHQDQCELFEHHEPIERLLERAISQVGERLSRSHEMAELRHRLALLLISHIGSDMVDMALRARLKPKEECLSAAHLNLVWRHWAMYRTMARENPRLLVALTAWLHHADCTSGPDSTDAVPAMMNGVYRAGLSQRAWRVLAENGVKPLLPSRYRGSAWAMLMVILRALNAARWPRLAPREVLRVLYDAAGLPNTFDYACNGVPGWFWQMACNEAAHLRSNANALKELSDSIPRWAWLQRKYDFHPDKNQRRRGCSWLRKEAQHYEKFELVAGIEEEERWFPWLRMEQWRGSGELLVVPLFSSSAMVAEAISLRNCADCYIDDCRNESQLFLSLRDRNTGRRLALVAARRFGQNWLLRQIAGPCNQEVNPSLRDQAEEAIKVVNQQYAARMLNGSLTVAEEEMS